MAARNNQWPSVPGTRKREGAKNIPVATWNVGTLNEVNRLEMLVGEMRRFGVELLGVAETHWTADMENIFKVEDFSVIASSRADGIRRQGVALIVSRRMADAMTSYEQISERLVAATFELESGPLSVLQVYGPDTSYQDEEYEAFLDRIQEYVDSIPRRNGIMILGDFNAKVGEREYITWPEVVGKYGLGQRNERGSMLLQFCAINGLVITNTFFKHKPCRRVTWVSPDGQTRNQIDYIIVKKDFIRNITNSRVYNSACVGSDHSLLIADVNVCLRRPRKTSTAPRRYNVSRLQDREMAAEFEQRISRSFEPLLQEEDAEASVENIYRQFVETTNKVTEEVVGFHRRKQVEGMSRELESKCAERRAARLDYLARPENDVARENYRRLNREVKQGVKVQKERLLQEKIEQLEREFRQNNSHNLFRAIRDLEEKPHRPLVNIKDENGKVLCNKEDVLRRWKDHFSQHLNTRFPYEENALDEVQQRDEVVVAPPSVEEVREAIKEMKNRKAPGFDQVTAEVLKTGGVTMVETVQHIFHKIWEEETTPKDWSRLLINPVFKKGDRLNPEKYRAISLSSVPCKVFCKIILKKICVQIEEFLGESQYGFRPTRGTIDAIFITRQVLEKAREHQVQVHFNFIDFKAAFDTVWREALWKFLAAVGVSRKVLQIIKSLYDNTECAVMVGGAVTEWFGVEVGVRQGCILSPSLFNIFLEFVMKELNCLDRNLNYEEKMSIDVRYADDTTLLAATFDKLNLSTEQLEVACKKWGLKINSNKCSVMTSDDGNILIDGNVVEKVDQFVFLGSVIPGSSDDVRRRIAMASAAFGKLKKSIWSRRDVSTNLKIRLYKCLILPIAIYASETWTLLAEDERRLNAFEMRCLRAIIGINWRHRRTNISVREELNMEETITDVIRTKRIKWFGHVMRRPPESYVQQAYTGCFQRRRPRGRPPKRWKDQIASDTGLPLGECEQLARDRVDWRGETGETAGRHRARGRYDLRP